MTRFAKIKNELKEHWSIPDTANGKYVSWKEHLDIFVGVAASYAAQEPIKYIGFAASCYLLMYHYSLPYLAFSMIALFGVPLSYLWDAIGWVVADNLGVFPKKTERKFYIFYAAAVGVGLILLTTDISKPFSPENSFIATLNSIEGLSAKSSFKVFGIQLFINAFNGARQIFWRKKLIPKHGRYKYSLYCNVIQKCVCIILIGWLPVYNIKDTDERLWVAYLLFSLFSMYDFGRKLEDCTSVISPNSQERLWVRSYTVKIAHILNSLVAFILPLLGRFDDINFYRWVLPGVFIPCAVLTMIFAGKITERIPQPPIEKKQPIPFWYGVFQVTRNKYEWLNILASLIDSLGNGALSLTTIVFLYSLRLSGLEYSIISIVLTFRSTIPAFIAPYFVKKYSFKTLRIFKQFVHISVCSVSVAALWLFGNNITACSIILFAAMFAEGFLVTVPDVAIADMGVRLRDYQMYLSGERIEGIKNIFNWFISPITSFIGLMIPLILLKNGFNSNWDILFLDSARFNIIALPILIDLVGHIFIVVPYLFWDYNKDQHEYVIDVLKQREKLANDGYFPRSYEGGLNFDIPEKIKNAMPANVAEYVKKHDFDCEKSVVRNNTLT